MKKILSMVPIVFFLTLFAFSQAEKVPGPAFKDVLSLKSVGNPVISPCGKYVLFTMRQPVEIEEEKEEEKK